MFDLIVEGQTGRPLRKTTIGSRIVSIVVHAAIVTAVFVAPILRVTHVVPPVPNVLAFAASVPAPPPPPPPPPAPAPAAPRPAVKPASTEPAEPVNLNAAPVRAPSEIAPETASVADKGVLGGVEGGVAGGVAGGIVGGLPSAVAPPPPPARRAPARIGGKIAAPALVKRVEPEYPDFAARARLSGLVILEATVDTSGHVETVKVLRSAHQVLDRLAIDALKQWEYSPLILDGVRTPFVLTVTFNFSVAPQ